MRFKLRFKNKITQRELRHQRTSVTSTLCSHLSKICFPSSKLSPPVAYLLWAVVLSAASCREHTLSLILEADRKDIISQTTHPHVLPCLEQLLHNWHLDSLVCIPLANSADCLIQPSLMGTRGYSCLIHSSIPLMHLESLLFLSQVSDICIYLILIYAMIFSRTLTVVSYIWSFKNYQKKKSQYHS